MFDVWILAQCTTVGVLLTDQMIMGCTVQDAHEQRGTLALEVYSGFEFHWQQARLAHVLLCSGKHNKQGIKPEKSTSPTTSTLQLC